MHERCKPLVYGDIVERDLYTIDCRGDVLERPFVFLLRIEVFQSFTGECDGEVNAAAGNQPVRLGFWERAALNFVECHSILSFRHCRVGSGGFPCEFEIVRSYEGKTYSRWLAVHADCSHAREGVLHAQPDVCVLLQRERCLRLAEALEHILIYEHTHGGDGTLRRFHEERVVSERGFLQRVGFLAEREALVPGLDENPFAKYPVGALLFDGNSPCLFGGKEMLRGDSCSDCDDGKGEEEPL